MCLEGVERGNPASERRQTEVVDREDLGMAVTDCLKCKYRLLHFQEV